MVGFCVQLDFFHPHTVGMTFYGKNMAWPSSFLLFHMVPYQRVQKEEESGLWKTKKMKDAWLIFWEIFTWFIIENKS